MIVPREERKETIESLGFSKHIEKLLLTHEVNEDLNDYFQTLSYIYCFDDSPFFKNRKLLGLWEQWGGLIYAFDLNNKEYIKFWLECDDDIDIIEGSIYNVLLSVFDLHVHEYGNGDEGAREVLNFANTIDFPHLNLLKEVLFEGTYSDEGLKKLENKLKVELRSEPD